MSLACCLGVVEALWGCAHEDAFGLEALVATGEAEQRSERVAGGQQRDDEDGENRLCET